MAPETVTALVDRLQPDPETPETEVAAVCPLLIDAEGNPASRIHPIPTRAELHAAARGEPLPSTTLANKSAQSRLACAMQHELETCKEAV